MARTGFDPFTAPLVALAPQPDGVRWPTTDWPTGPAPDGVNVEAFFDEMFDDDGPMATSYAAVVIHKGKLIGQRYAHAMEHFDRAPDPIDEATPLLSWSMAKSMLHAVVGLLVANGKLTLDSPPGVPEWADATDGRETITLQQLLEMRDGLDFVEDYVDDRVSDVIAMLFGDGKDDVAHFAADRGLAHPPGTHLNYSSGTSNIVSGIVARAIGHGDPYRGFLHDRLFGPIGMRSATATFDPTGTFIASSYVYATAQDMARFGYLYLRDGMWDGTRLLPEGWVDHARRVRSVEPDGISYYGAHWWLHGDEYGTFRCSGYEGQRIVVCPALDVVAVRLGKTPADHYPDLRDWYNRLIATFAAAAE